MSENGNALQVVEVTEQHSYRLDEGALGRALLADEVKDLPVMVVSLAGAHRGGKSFMLNFFLRYLFSPESAQKDGSWLGGDQETLTGFSWRGGSKRNTTGILLWSEPIVTTLPNGTKAAVVLMDTQGTFDSTSTVRDCSTIFALSTLISSVQVYNIPGGVGIQEDDLQHLQLFSEYGKLIGQSQGTKAFQVLDFLVRDWANEYEYSYGNEGGQHYVDEVLKVTKDMHPELRELRQSILASFETVTCFLMPHPGKIVRKQTFTGKTTDMDSDFIVNLKALANSIFAKENLKLKEINGQEVKCKELFAYFKAYMNLFNSKEVPTPKGIMEVTTEAGLLLAVSEATERYQAAMAAGSAADAPVLPAAEVKRAHERELAAARAFFQQTKKLASKEQADKYLTKLTEDLEKLLPHYATINAGKNQQLSAEAMNLYEKLILDVSGDSPLCVHPTDLQKIHEDAVAKAVAFYDARRTTTLIKDPERDYFINMFNMKIKSLKLSNEQNNKMAISDIRDTYWETMQSASLLEPPLSSAEFEEQHRAALAAALGAFQQRRSRPTQYLQDVYKTTLENNIIQTFKNMKLMNKSLKKAALTSAINEYKTYMKKNIHNKCKHPVDLERDHEAGKCEALQKMRADVSCPSEMSYDDDEDVSTLMAMINQSYAEWKDLNDLANRSAVQEALSFYTKKMEENCKPNWWWLLIVPIFIDLSKISNYHKQFKEAAVLLFWSKREGPTSHFSDYYFESLSKNIDEVYSTYEGVANKLTDKLVLTVKSFMPQIMHLLPTEAL